MEMLPKESQPIEGTEGADSRMKQMHIQLPAHDQAPELCQNLTDKEVKDMEDFVKDYKEHAVGIGQVQEVQVHSGGSSFQLTGAPPNAPPVAPKPGKKVRIQHDDNGDDDDDDDDNGDDGDDDDNDDDDDDNGDDDDDDDDDNGDDDDDNGDDDDDMMMMMMI